MMHNDDDSWELAAQAALELHRRAISAVRERVTIGRRTHEKGRPRPRSRPVSAPSGSAKRRPPSAIHHDSLVPSPPNVSQAINRPSRVELEAWATLNHSTQRPCPSRSMATLDIARPKSAVDHHFNSGRPGGAQPSSQVANTRDKHLQKTNALHHNLKQLGISPTSTSSALEWAKYQPQGLEEVSLTPFGSAGKHKTGFLGTADDWHIGSRSSSFAHPGHRKSSQRMLTSRGRDLDCCGTRLGKNGVVCHGRNEQNRSVVSVRFLREHARKAMKEEKDFLRTIKAEAKVQETSEIEMIHRATQWSRDLDRDLLYLPHRVDGKLHVLKIENGFEAKMLDNSKGRDTRRFRGIEEYGKVISIDLFLKGDHARLEKEHRAALRGAESNKESAGLRLAKRNEHTKRRTNTSRNQKVRELTSAADTCRELHRLIKDTVGLVEVLTRQAMELEAQGWNRLAGDRQIDRKKKASR